MTHGYNSVERELAENGSISCCTAGTSMYPMLRNKRDMVTIVRPKSALKNNDVVLYRTLSGKLVLHRIIKVTSDGYIIRGDNLTQKETGIKSGNIIGILESFCRNGKFTNCKSSKLYKIYIFYIRISFPLRLLKHKCGNVVRYICRKEKT